MLNCDLVGVGGIVGICHVHHIHLVVNRLIAVCAFNRDDALGESSLDFGVHTVHILHRADITQRGRVSKHNADCTDRNRKIEAVASCQSLTALAAQAANQRRVHLAVLCLQRTVEAIAITGDFARCLALVTGSNLTGCILVAEIRYRNGTLTVSRRSGNKKIITTYTEYDEDGKIQSQSVTETPYPEDDCDLDCECCDGAEADEDDDDAVYQLTPKGIACLALLRTGLVESIEDPRIDGFWELFQAYMDALGYTQEVEE